ncbi:hypothetical protein ACHHYP_15738 [Achlya hypogyna]|uniref:Uncharacterized protein n=1 Tax=Achlya hypogyna TaxID=1202772 RepID=A0A1V9YAA1_ACHHY|nr:hypothetical protein ACHHYP_15738 [Achlya hypogyna]
MPSHWESIEAVHDVVFAHSCPLTQFLNDRFDISSLSTKAKVAIWEEAFRSDWPGNLALLPAVNLEASSYRLIRTRSMYARVQSGVPTSVVSMDTPHLAAALENVWLDELAPLKLAPLALAHAAVFGGHVALLEDLVSHAGVDPTALGEIKQSYHPLAMDAAALAGHLHMVQWLHNAGSNEVSYQALEVSACLGHLEIVHWLMKHRGYRPSAAVLSNILYSGHINVIDFFARDCGLQLPGDALSIAAQHGQLQLVHYLHEEWGHPCSSEAFEKAAIYGHLPVVQYLHARSTESCTTDAMDGAACLGHLDTLRFLHEHRTEGCTTFALDAAARNNRMDVLEFLHEHRTEGGSTRAMDRAAHRGHETVVRFLHEHRMEGCTTRAIDWAASAGHVSIVRFLATQRSEGCTFRAYLWAAVNHRFQVLEYLLSLNGARPMAAQAVECALRLGNRRAFTALQTAGCPGTQDVAMDAVVWDDDSEAGFALVDDVLQDDGDEDGYWDWDSDDSTDACMF